MLSFALHKIVGKESSGARSGPEHSLELEKGGCVAVKGGGELLLQFNQAQSKYVRARSLPQVNF